MNVEIIDDSGAFTALRSEWNELLAASRADSPFLTWEWLNAWWTHLGAPRRLAIMAVREGRELVGIAPMSISRARLPWFWRWEFLGTGLAGSDYLDVIAREGYEAEILRHLADFVQSRNLALRLDRLPPNSVLAKLTPRFTECGWIVREVSDGVCSYIPLAGHSWDSFLATIGPSSRATTRRRLRTLDRDHKMRFEPVTTHAHRREVLEKLIAFHAARWDDRGTAFQKESLRKFHDEATERMLGGCLRLYALYLDDDLAAAMYGFAYNNRFYFYQHGFDARYRQHGVGRAVLDLTIRAAIAEGLSEFDLLWGDEPYKRSWTQQKRSLTRIDLFPPHLGGRLHRRSVEAERTMRTFARRVISLSAHATQTS